ncbi:MAG: hypothetical protein JXR03_12190 [Cyclobacteriaceae bacterium]
MKNILIIALALSLCIGESIAQKKKKGPTSVGEKQINFKGGYGQKKLKKAPKKIYISKFNVYFNVIATATAKTTGGRTVGGGSVRAGTSTTMTVGVDGVDVPDFQAITDNAYARFIKEFESRGYEFLSTEEASKAKYYEGWEMKEGGNVNYANIPGYVSVTPTGTKYMIKKQNRKGKEKTTALNMNNTMILSGQLEDVLVAQVTLAFPCIDMSAKGGVYATTSKVSANVNYRMGTAFGQEGMQSNFAPSQMVILSGKGPGLTSDAYFYSSLKEPIYSGESVFKNTEFKERTYGGTSPAYYGIVFQDNESSKVTHSTEADKDVYISESNRLIDEFMDISFEEFWSYH